MCDALDSLLDNIFIRFGSKFCRHIVGISMGTDCAARVAYLLLFCYEGDLMLSLSDNNQTAINEYFNSTSRYLDDLLNIDNPNFEQLVTQIYHAEMQINKANCSDTEPRGVYISQLIYFARVCSNVGDFNNRHLFLTA